MNSTTPEPNLNTPVTNPAPASVPVKPKKDNKKKVAWLVFGAIIILSLGINSVETAKNIQKVSKRPIKYAETVVQGEGNNKIALIRIEGVIVDTGSAGGNLLSSSQVGAEDIINQIDQAEDDDAVKAIILSINSPGGTVPASQMVAEKIKKFKKTGKKVIALMREEAASGGYYIASQADKIVANPSVLTGSIGVVLELQNWQGLYGKIGIRPVTIKAGKFKDIGSDSRIMTPEERRMFQDLVNEDYEMFLQAVSDGRKMELSQVRRIAEGKIYSGRQAKDLKLVDVLGNMPDAVRETETLINNTDTRVIEYSSSWVNNIFGLFPSGMNNGSIIDKLIGKKKQVKFSGTLYLREQ